MKKKSKDTKEKNIVNKRKSIDDICEYLCDIGSKTIKTLFDSKARDAFDPVTAAKSDLSKELLKSLPFGSFLEDCAGAGPSRTVSKKYDNRTHLLYVVSGMIDALNGNQSKFLADQDEFSTFHARLMAEAAEEKYNQNMLRKVSIVSALYHDLGKAISGERHPYEGYHIIKDLGQVRMVENGSQEIPASKDFRKWFEASDDLKGGEEEANYFFRFFLKLLRYHDMWGNITTGEASMVMLSSAIDLNDRPSGAKIFLGHLVLLNLADQFGTPALYKKTDCKPQCLDSEMLRALIGRWNIVANVLSKTREDPEEVRAELLRSAGQASETVNRLYALLRASGISIKERRDVNEILKAVCGGRYYAFCEDFGVVRLSYALRFFRSLRERAEQENSYLPLDRQFTPYRQALLVLTVLKRILDTYEPLIRANKAQKSETGIEMSWLARSDEVKDSIIQTLLGQERESALSWIDDEVSAFPCR